MLFIQYEADFIKRVLVLKISKNFDKIKEEMEDTKKKMIKMKIGKKQ